MSHFKSLSELHRASGFPPPEHPLLSLLTCREWASCSLGDGPVTTDCYMISLTKMQAGQFRYGKTRYDHEAGSLSFVRPRQVVDIRGVELTEKAFTLLLHEDYLLGHALHAEIKKYGFFDYETNEALHLAPREEQVLWALYRQIEHEYRHNQDKYSQAIILTHVASMLQYAQRFYARQFLNRRPLSGPMISRFMALLTTYFERDLLQQQGLPTVRQLADELNTSPRYLTDVLKQETGKTALDHLHLFLLGEAKNLLLSADQTIAQTAYQLGFKNPPYFTRLFRKEVGLTPHAYRAQFLN